MPRKSKPPEIWWCVLICYLTKCATCHATTCPDGFGHYGQYCYKFFLDEKNYTDAVAACGEIGAILAEPRSKNESDAIFSILKIKKPQKQTAIKCWLGADKLKVPGSWRWLSDNQEFEFTRWGKSPLTNPPMRTYYDCLVVLWFRKWHWANGWRDEICHTQRSYLCQADQTPVSECPEDFFLQDETCYKFVSHGKPHKEAAALCTGVGGFLTEPLVKEENERINKIMADNKVGLAWIGAQDKLDFRKFVWGNGGKMTYLNWAPCRPGPHTWDEICQPSPWEEIQHCLALELNKGWNDKTCYDKLPFICQAKKAITHGGRCGEVGSSSCVSGLVCRSGTCQCPATEHTYYDGSTCQQEIWSDLELKRIQKATGSAEQPNHASLVELLIGAILTWAVIGHVAYDHGQ